MKNPDLLERIIDKKTPIIVHFDLTYKCNLECKHCYVSQEEINELSLKEIKNILEQLSHAGTMIIGFSGGEILTHPHFFEIAEYARNLKFALTLLTNGTLINEHKAEKIAALKPLKVRISLYGTNSKSHDIITQRKGSFDKIINGVKLLIKNGVRVELFFILMKLDKINANIDDYRNIELLSENLGAEFKVYTHITPKMDGNQQNINLQLDEDNILDIYRFSKNENLSIEINDEQNHSNSNIICRASHTFCYISPYGDIYPCPLLRNKCGNLKKEKFKTIWNHSSEMNKVRTNTRNMPTNCLKCELLSYCNQCPAFMESEENELKCSKTIYNNASILKKIHENKH